MQKISYNFGRDGGERPDHSTFIFSRS